MRFRKVLGGFGGGSMASALGWGAGRGAAHTVMQAEKLFSPEPKQVVSANRACLGRVDVDGLLQAWQITSPNGVLFAMDDEVEPWIAETLSGGGGRKATVQVDLRSHEYDGVAVRQREHNLHARTGMAGDGTDGVAVGIEDILRGQQLTDPGCLKQLSGGGIAYLQDAAGHSPAAVERREGNIELLEATAEEDGENASEGTKETMPL